MSKVYTTISMVASDDGEDFTDKLNQKITELQYPARGQYVEVQFQANGKQAIALVLQYKMGR